MQKQKQKSVMQKRGLYIALALALFVGAPVLGAILVQNFTQWDVVVDTPPVAKLQGADVALTNYLDVNLAGTISNGNGTNLSHEEISFTCFAGDRTYYTDVIQLSNTTVGENWAVTLTVEADLNGQSDVADTFTAGAANIWLIASDADSSAALTTIPNPASLPAGWNSDMIQLDVVAGALSAADSTVDVGTIAAGEQRQLALVVDCGEDMVDTETGTFRMTVASSPQ